MFGLLKLLPGWPWFGRPIKTVPADAGWEKNAWYASAKNLRLALLAHERNKLKAQIETAKRAKKRRVHLYAALEANTAERLRVEGGGQ